MNDVYRIFLLKFVLSLGMQYSKYKYFVFHKTSLGRCTVFSQWLHNTQWNKGKYFTVFQFITFIKYACLVCTQFQITISLILGLNTYIFLNDILPSYSFDRGHSLVYRKYMCRCPGLAFFLVERHASTKINITLTLC